MVARIGAQNVLVNGFRSRDLPLPMERDRPLKSRGGHRNGLWGIVGGRCISRARLGAVRCQITPLGPAPRETDEAATGCNKIITSKANNAGSACSVTGASLCKYSDRIQGIWMRLSRWVKSPALAALLGLVISIPASAASEQQSLEELRDTVINLLQALVDQGVMTKQKAEQLVKQAQTKASADLAARTQEEQGSVRVPYVPEIVKQEISKQVAEQVRPAVAADVIQQAKSEGWGVPGALPDWLKHVRIAGELTLRGQADLYGHGNDLGCPPGTLFGNCTILDFNAINQAGGFARAGTATAFLNINQDRYRMRARARLGAEVDLSDSWHAGIRLASGVLQDPSSESQNLGSEFGRYTVGLDEVYLRWDARTADKFSYATVNGGRFLNPFFSPTELVYARELAFDGVAATGRIGFGQGGPDRSGLFLTLGGFPVQEVPLVSKNNKWLVGGQLGTTLRWGEGQRFVFAAAYYDFIRVEGVPNPDVGSTINNYTAPAFVRHGNTMFDISNSTDTTVNLFALASRFRVADLATTYVLPVGSRYTFAVDGEASRNLGFDRAEILARTGFDIQPRVNGYVGDFSFGDPSPAAAGRWRTTFGYRYVQRDAVLDALTDADFHEGGTDAAGYFLAGDLGLANGVWARLRYLSGKQIDPPLYHVNILQLDFNARF